MTDFAYVAAPCTVPQTDQNGVQSVTVTVYDLSSVQPAIWERLVSPQCLQHVYAVSIFKGLANALFQLRDDHAELRFMTTGNDW